MAEANPGLAAYLGTARVVDPFGHRTYNAWHQMDHLPENLALDGVRWGQRWVRTPSCADAALVAEDEWTDFHYLTNYWLNDPVDESIERWARLADESFQWGRRPDVGITERSFLSFFRPVSGLVASRIEIDPSVLPLRPNTGIYVTISMVEHTAGASRAALEARYRWYRTVGFPAMVSRPGVAGVWALASAHDLAPASWAAQEASTAASMPLARAHIYYMDDDPLSLARDVAVADLLAPGDEAQAVERLVFAGPLEAITPYQWDWFG